MQVDMPGRQIKDAPWDEHGGIIHQNVDMAISVESTLSHGMDLFFVTNVGFDGHGLATGCGNLLHGLMDGAGQARVRLDFRQQLPLCL
jgi:hypothetical protein